MQNDEVCHHLVGEALYILNIPDRHGDKYKHPGGLCTFDACLTKLGGRTWALLTLTLW